MLENNLNIGESLRKFGKEEQILKSLIFSTIIEIYKLEKNIDLSEYLISVKISENNITIKTNNPLINSELLIYEKKIISSLKEKIKKIGIIHPDFNFKYI